MQRSGLSEYNSQMLRVRYVFESPCTTFPASHCYTLRAQGMKSCTISNVMMIPIMIKFIDMSPQFTFSSCIFGILCILTFL